MTQMISSPIPNAWHGNISSRVAHQSSRFRKEYILHKHEIFILPKKHNENSQHCWALKLVNICKILNSGDDVTGILHWIYIRVWSVRNCELYRHKPNSCFSNVNTFRGVAKIKEHQKLLDNVWRMWFFLVHLLLNLYYFHYIFSTRSF